MLLGFPPCSVNLSGHAEKVIGGKIPDIQYINSEHFPDISGITQDLCF